MEFRIITYTNMNGNILRVASHETNTRQFKCSKKYTKKAKICMQHICENKGGPSIIIFLVFHCEICGALEVSCTVVFNRHSKKKFGLFYKFLFFGIKKFESFHIFLFYGIKKFELFCQFLFFEIKDKIFLFRKTKIQDFFIPKHKNSRFFHSEKQK